MIPVPKARKLARIYFLNLMKIEGDEPDARVVDSLTNHFMAQLVQAASDA
jgi:hypothetical protein